jgi:C-terminal processing protease CtpA/Prc
VEIDKDAMAGKWQLKKVFAQSPADLAGLREGDWISGVEDLNFDREWSEIQDAYKKLIRPGNAVLYHVERNGEKLSIRVTLTTMPLDVQDRFIGHHMRVYHAKTLPPSP